MLHISASKSVRICTFATIIMHICTATVGRLSNILDFFLSPSPHSLNVSLSPLSRFISPLVSPISPQSTNHSQENKLRSHWIPSRADGVRGRDSEARMERMATAVARRWRCYEASIALRSVGCWFFFLVFWLIVGVGRWVLILIGLFFLVHWWVLMILPPIGWVMNGFEIEWV